MYLKANLILHIGVISEFLVRLITQALILAS